MKLELWARSRETMRYEYLWRFDDERQKFFMIDQVDSDKYSEAMIIKGKGIDQDLIMYEEFKEHKPYRKEKTLCKTKER